MYFYYVWVRSSRYHSKEPLTYSSDFHLPSGKIVEVELQKEHVLGIVVGTTTEPRFKTKSIEHVYDLPVIPKTILRLGQWIQAYYPSSIGTLAQQFLPVKLSTKQIDASRPHNLPEPDMSKLPPLTKEQENALVAMEESGSYILHGKTGSGKTRVYIELAAKAIIAGSSAIILTPEISLTSQLAKNFRQVFGDRVVVMHSQQLASERQKAWLDALISQDPLVIIGPRSTLFSPLAKIGLIVLDESHESSYKQGQSPYYQAGRVAAYLARLHHATLILGSATPSVVDYYLAEKKHKPIIRLSHLAQKQKGEKVKPTIIDIKDRSGFPRSTLISLPLIHSIEKSLRDHEQSLLYLNRRGTARMVMCENCGWQAICPKCDVPLAYHGDYHQLRCHSCNYHSEVLASCPVCNFPSIIFKTAGTKAIVEEVSRLFPNANVSRFDTDNLKSERFEQQYSAIHNGEIDILVGTQMLAKGLDLPRLSTLGILLADTSLYLPDFSAQERTFQLLNQVMGRVSRGHVAGRSVIQTYHPEHPMILAAIDDNYKEMYETELKNRQQFLFPPFCYLLKLTARRSGLETVENVANKLKTDISSKYRVRVEGPAPSFHERFQGKYQWQLIVKSKERSALLNIINELPANWSYDIDPIDLL
jgi:primosomal protein N' (replication factor Y)